VLYRIVERLPSGREKRDLPGSREKEQRVPRKKENLSLALTPSALRESLARSMKRSSRSIAAGKKKKKHKGGVR